jgi:hypothetical protein
VIVALRCGSGQRRPKPEIQEDFDHAYLQTRVGGVLRS